MDDSFNSYWNSIFNIEVTCMVVGKLWSSIVLSVIVNYILVNITIELS